MFLSWWHYFVEKKKEKISSCFSTVARLRYGEGCCCLQLSRRKRRFCCYRVRPASWNNESVCVFFSPSLWLPRKSDSQHASVSTHQSPQWLPNQVSALPFHSASSGNRSLIAFPVTTSRQCRPSASYSLHRRSPPHRTCHSLILTRRS